MLSTQHDVIYYAHGEGLWEICAPLLARHAAQGGAWRYIADEHQPGQVAGALRARGLNVEEEAIIASAKLSFHASPVRVAPIITALQEFLRQAAGPHPRGVLLLVEMTWAIRSPSGAVYLREYEAALHELLERQGASAVCLYNLTTHLDSQLLLSLHMHQGLHDAGGRYANPYLVPPAIYRRRDERAQFLHWLEALRPGLAAAPAGSPAQPAGPRTVELAPPAAQPVYDLEAPALFIARNSDQGQWKIRCFGQLRVYRADGELVRWQVGRAATRKSKTLFAFLLYRGEAGAAAEELTALLWPDAADGTAALNRLYHVVNGLREVLSPGLGRLRASPFVLNEQGRYYLAVPPHTWIDLPMFQELCYRGARLLREGDLDQALICYGSAERLYTGDYLADIPQQYADYAEDDWFWGRRYWLRDMYVKLLYGIAAIHRGQGAVAAALSYADRALRLEPTSEAAQREKLLALHSARRRDALDRQYRLYCQLLDQAQLGPPSPELTGLYQQLRAQLGR
jgi:two-component SAPR family response regulator